MAMFSPNSVKEPVVSSAKEQKEAWPLTYSVPAIAICVVKANGTQFANTSPESIE
jgi:hypothetical protein